MTRRGDQPPIPAVARVADEAADRAAEDAVDAALAAAAAEQRRRRAAPPAYRPGRPEEAAALAGIWQVSIADYERRLGRPIASVDLGPVTRLIEHLAGTDPERFWVAERGGRPVGFGQAAVRGDLWFLGLLFVLPEEQAAGVGRELFARTLPGARLPGRGEHWEEIRPPGAPLVLATTTDAAQPISNALYAKAGLVPRLPAYRIVGRPDRPGALGPLPHGIEAVGIAGQRGTPEVTLDEPTIVAALDAIDGAVLGTPRRSDHAWRRGAGRAYLYRRADGRPVGYGYVTMSGYVGPVAVLDPAHLAPVVGHLLDAHPPAGPSAIAVHGEAHPLFRALLEAGFRVDGFPALLCWTAPFAQLDRYLLGSYALP